MKAMMTSDEHLQYCEDGDPPIPGAAHYNWHYRTGRAYCLKARNEYSMYRYKKRYKTLVGYTGCRDIPMRTEEQLAYCDGENPPRPSISHYSWHLRHGSDYCEKSYIELSMYSYQARHGTMEGHKGRRPNPMKLEDHMAYCSDGETPRPSTRHSAYHRHRKIPICRKGLLEEAMYKWLMRHPDADEYDPSAVVDMPHNVYRYEFESDGAVYYGITSTSVDRRRRYGYNLAMTWRLVLGDPYIVEVIDRYPNRALAARLERELIRNHKGTPLLNRRHAAAA